MSERAYRREAGKAIDNRVSESQYKRKLLPFNGQVFYNFGVDSEGL
jgi:hypothetical protein